MTVLQPARTGNGISGDLEEDLISQLRASTLFAMFDEAECRELVKHFYLQTLPMGREIFKLGDEGQRMYLILSGRVRLQITGSDGRPMTLAVIGSGELFGEGAILGDGRRGANARVSEDALLATIEKEDFDRFVSQRPNFARSLAYLAENRALMNLLRKSAIGRSLPPALVRRMLPEMKVREYDKGEIVFNGGDMSDGMYIVTKGQFIAQTYDNGRASELTRYGAGEFFGERSLRKLEPRAASLVALQPSACLFLSRVQFEEMAASSPQFLNDIDEHIGRYGATPVGTVPVPMVEPEYSASSTVEAAGPVASGDQATERAVHKKMWRYPNVRQHLEADCGAACLAMIGRYYGQKYSLSRLRDLANVSSRGTTLLNLARAGEAIGFTARAMKLDLESLASVELPAILFWDGYHYVVLWELGKKNAVIGDPARGSLTVPIKEFRSRWSGFALTLSPNGEIASGDHKSMLKQVAPMIRRHLPVLWEIFLVTMVIAGLGLSMPLFSQTILDKILPRGELDLLTVVLVGMALVWVFSTLGSLLQNFLLLHVSQKLRLQLSQELFRRLLRLPIAYFRKRRIGEVVARFGDNEVVQDLLTGGAIGTVINVLMVVIYLALMIYYNASLSLVAIAYLVFSAVFVIAVSPAMKRNNQILFEKSATADSKLIEALQNIDTIKATNSEILVRWEYENNLVDVAAVRYRVGVFGMFINTIASSMELLVSLGMLWLGANAVAAKTMTVGEFVAFQSLLMMSVEPVKGLVGMYQSLQETFLSLERLGDIYEAEPEERSKQGNMPAVRGQVTFDNVTFGYDADNPPIIKSFSLQVAPGETVAFVGRSGSGKTTLISLLQRFYNPSKGRILIDGIDLSNVTAESVRRQIGIVLQETQLFSATIRENITYGNTEASTDQLVEAAKIANAHDFISALPLGYDTFIGEVGVRLSGGQRQRIAIARAILSNPRILVFDEATSALDTESERAIQKNLATILKGRTAFIIAHRLSTIQNADRIVVLDDGQIVEQGTFDELIKSQGMFYYLVRQQVGG